MRLTKIKKTLDEVLPHLKVSAREVIINGTAYTELGNLIELRNSILKLIAENVFFEEATAILQTEIFEFSKDTNNLDHATARNIITNVEALRRAAYHFKNALDEAIPQEKGNTVYIKLPEIRDFKDLAISAEQFNLILSQLILNDEIGGDIKIEMVENGSIWLEVFVGSAKAASIIGAVAYSSALAYREIQKGRLIAETRRSRQIRNDKQQKLEEAFEIMLDELMEAEAFHINSTHFSNDDPERLLRIKHVIKLLSEEMSKGAEVAPSLTAPEEIKKMFPEIKELQTMVSRIKEIMNKPDSPIG